MSKLHLQVLGKQEEEEERKGKDEGLGRDGEGRERGGERRGRKGEGRRKWVSSGGGTSRREIRDNEEEVEGEELLSFSPPIRDI